MQSRVLHIEEDSAYVEVRDLFKADGTFLRDWTSQKAIEIGTKPYGTWETVDCDISNHQNTTVWLRTDAWMPDVEDPTTSIQIANFTREVPEKMTVLTGENESTLPEKSFIIFSLKAELTKDYQFEIRRTLPEVPSSDGVDWPVENSTFNVTFEVRLDRKPHPFSWARLPPNGPFPDWDQANSWAVSMDREDADRNPQSKYLHCEQPLVMVDKDSPDSLLSYARGIEMIHWLFNERIPADQQHHWFQTPPMATMKVIKYDHVEQKITVQAGPRVTTTTQSTSD